MSFALIMVLFALALLIAWGSIIRSRLALFTLPCLSSLVILLWLFPQLVAAEFDPSLPKDGQILLAGLAILGSLFGLAGWVAGADQPIPQTELLRRIDRQLSGLGIVAVLAVLGTALVQLLILNQPAASLASRQPSGLITILRTLAMLNPVALFCALLLLSRRPHNRADTLADAIRSLNAQTHADKEHLIIDGASTDGTLTVAHQEKQPFTRIFSAPDRGIYDALNKGLSIAQGDVVGVLHSDDMFADPKVLEQIARAFEDPNIDAVYGDLTYVAQDNPDRVIRNWRSGPFDPKALRAGWMPPHPTVFLRRDLIDQVDFYDTSFRIAADYDAILRTFGKSGFNAVHIPRVLVKMRVGGASNGSIGRIITKSREDFRALRRNGVSPATPALVMKNVSKLPQFLGRGAA